MPLSLYNKPYSLLILISLQGLVSVLTILQTATFFGSVLLKPFL